MVSAIQVGILDVLLLAASSACTATPRVAGSSNVLVGWAPPAIDRPTLDGRIAQIPANARVTVVDFWATWCRPCMEAMPGIEAMWRAEQHRGLFVVGVAADDNPGKVAQVLKRLGITYPVVLDEGNALRGQYQVTDLPVVFVHDRSGRVRFAVTGGGQSGASELAKGVSDLLSEEP